MKDESRPSESGKRKAEAGPSQHRALTRGHAILARTLRAGLSCLLLFSFFLLPSSAFFLFGAEPVATDLERNRRLLEQWRSNPEHYQRLLQDLRAFGALTPEQQQRLRRLDQDLNNADPNTRRRLWKVLERYSRWLQQLPDSERQRITTTADPQERLRIIREIRQRQWLERLPRKVREDVLKLPPEKRAAEIARLRQEERQQRNEWQKPLRFRIAHLNEYPPEVQKFVEQQLLPRLSIEEKERLRKAEGRGPQLARVLLDLSERHPVLPPGPYHAATRYANLPEEVKRLLSPDHGKKQHAKKLHEAEGKWPDYALMIAELLKREHQTSVSPLGACRPHEFPQPIKVFLRQKLTVALSDAEMKQLHQAEGHWPDYPLLLVSLARRHNLSVPGMSLPGPPEWWDSIANRDK